MDLPTDFANVPNYIETKILKSVKDSAAYHDFVSVFIDKFYINQRDGDKFVIDLDDVYTYLGYKSSSVARKVLYKRFMDGADYYKIILENNGSIDMLSIFTFRRWACFCPNWDQLFEWINVLDNSYRDEQMNVIKSIYSIQVDAKHTRLHELDLLKARLLLAEKNHKIESKREASLTPFESFTSRDAI